jgi:hypothetical protein
VPFQIGFISFIPLDSTTPKIFGFSEFLAGLALMVLVWTIADARYRFRVHTTPFPLQNLTFGVVVALGGLTLLTDLWRAEQWPVPEGNIITPSEWQAFLGGMFILTFLTWAWYAFIRPPFYGKMNAQRYAHALYRSILKGSASELPVIADEFAHSVKSLIYYSTYGLEKKPPKVTVYANDILLLIGDKRFCRSIVESSPGTALAVFREIEKTEKYGVQIGTFARNIVNAALLNNDSFLFHEAEGYESGLIGYHKPLSQAMFSNYRMVESIGTLLDPDLDARWKWNAAQWAAYCRIVLITFHDYVNRGHGEHVYVLYRAIKHIEEATSDLYKLNGIDNSTWNDDANEKLRIVVKFIKDAIEILDKKGVPDAVHRRIQTKALDRSFYDHLADMIFQVIFDASAVTSPPNLCWWIQRNTIWGEMFNFNNCRGAAADIVKFKVRRLLYNEVAEMKHFPNFKGSRILAFCLNVLGLKVSNQDYYRDSRALHRAILLWIKKNYAWLHGKNPRVAEDCLGDGISYDAVRLKLTKEHPAEGLRLNPECVYFEVDPPSPEEIEPV